MGESTTSAPKKGGQPADTSWHQKWLECFALTGNVTAACVAVGIPRRSAYEHRDQFPEFKAAWEEAKDTAADALEAEARRRAVEGEEQTWTDKDGNEHTSVRRSDALLIFLLKGNKPDKFRERQDIRHEGAVPVKHIVLEDEAKPQEPAK